MGWLGHSQFAIFCFAIVTLTGCSSTIKTYDSTFTSALLAGSATSTHSGPARSANTRRRKGRIARQKKSHFIEFRARSALSYGHALVVFGKLDKNGKVPVDKKGVLIPGTIEISGLHPASTSTIPWSVGHVIPVPAETGPSDGDFEDNYVTARYRINLTENEFRKVVAIVAKHKKRGILWSGPVKNCMSYIGAIAKDMGLKSPPIPVLYYPQGFVENLKKLNT